MNVSIASIPETIQEFSNSPQMDLSRPENTCAMFLLALNLYVRDQNEGVEAMNMLRGPRPMSPYDCQFLRDRLRGKAYLPLAYFDGAVPGNNYTPGKPLTVQVLPDPRPQDIPEGYLRLYLRTAGADSPRPLKLRGKGGQWYLWEYSSVLSGIRIPAAEDPWA